MNLKDLRRINEKAKEIRKKRTKELKERITQKVESGELNPALTTSNNDDAVPAGFAHIHLYNYRKGNNAQIVNAFKKYGQKDKFNDTWEFGILRLGKAYDVGFRIDIDILRQNVDCKKKAHQDLLEFLRDEYNAVGIVKSRLD